MTAKPPLSNVGPGDPIPLDQVTWNAMIGAGRDFLRSSPGFDAPDLPGGPTVPHCMVLVRNDTGTSLPAFSAVKLGKPLVSAVDYPHQVRRLPVFGGPALAGPTDAFGITIEPATASAPTNVVRAVVAGVAVADLLVNAATHGYAVPAGNGLLTSQAEYGPAKVVWRAGASGQQRAVVILGVTPGLKSDSAYQTIGSILASTNPVTVLEWQDPGSNYLHLPTAGRYRLYAEQWVTGNISATPPGLIFARLYDHTAGAVVPRSVAPVMTIQVVGQLCQGKAVLCVAYDVDEASDIAVQLAIGGTATWTAATGALAADTDQATHVDYVRIGDRRVTPPGSIPLSAGTSDVADLAVPDEVDVTVELWGGGGQGGGGDEDGGGGGGGSGGYLKVVVPAALWALGGSIVVGLGGSGGESDQDGNAGGDSTLTLNAILRGSAGGGAGGTHHDSGGAGGAGGTNSTGAGVTVDTNTAGAAGANAVGTTPGAGGVNPTDATHGDGGAGGGAFAAGIDGQDGGAVVSWG